MLATQTKNEALKLLRDLEKLNPKDQKLVGLAVQLLLARGELDKPPNKKPA